MTAFGHSIHYDYLPPQGSYKQQHLPKISLKAFSGPIDTFSKTINYEQNQGRDVALSTDLSFYENREDQRWSFIVKDIVSFFWKKGDRSIYYSISDKTDTRLLEYWFLHTLLPIYFTVEGKYEFIHAGGVTIDSKAVLFIAPSFGGKSTLTDYFLQREHPLISDDKIALCAKENEIISFSSYPYHRPYRKMEDLGIRVESFVKESKALHMIYALEAVNADKKVSFTRLQGIEKFKALQYNFDFNLPLNKANSFELISKIAANVPVYKISIPWDTDRLGEVYDMICQHSKHPTP